MKVNYLQNEVTIKMVYCGPPSSGKKTNLRFIQKSMRHCSSKTEFLYINQKSIMFFYIYPPELPNIAGFKPRLEFYGMPSNDCHKVREFLLQDADGIVVIVDSNKNKIGENRRYLERLEQNLNSMGIDIFDVVTVIQVNKCDLTKSFLHSQEALKYFGIPSCPAICAPGSEEGIWPTLQQGIFPVRQRIGNELPHTYKSSEKITHKLLKNIKPTVEYNNCTFQLENKSLLRECIFVDCTFRGKSQIKSINKCLFDNCKFDGTFSIDLSRKSLNHLPRWVFHGTFIKKLILSDNKLSRSTFLFRLAKFQHLSHLYLNNNGFTTIPKSLNRLQNLKLLDLSQNNISSYHRTEIKSWLPNCKIHF